MEKSILSQKDFRQSPDILAAETKAIIRKIKRHIEEDKCTCCAEALRKR